MTENDTNTADRVSEEAPMYGRRPWERNETVDLVDVHWMFHDSEQDGLALRKLGEFLQEHGLRKQPSTIDSAIQAINELTGEVATLRAELATRNGHV